MKKSGIILAATVGALFASAVIADDMSSNSGSTDMLAAKSSVKCMGVNSCKGKGKCKTPGNTCKGKNDCKGKGIRMMKSEKACTDKGGSVVSDS